MPAPTKLAVYSDIDISARKSALTAVATMVDNWNTYWSSVTPKAKILDPSCGDPYVHSTTDVNAIISCVNAMNTEFSLGATPTPLSNGLDYNGLQTILNQIIAQMLVMQTAKP